MIALCASKYLSDKTRYAFDGNFEVKDLCQPGPELTYEMTYYKSLYQQSAAEIKVETFFYFE